MRLPPAAALVVRLQSFKLLPLLIASWLLATSVATAQTVTVNGVTSGAIAVAPGSTLSVSVSNGAGNLYDWVGFFQTGATNYVDWRYMNGQSPRYLMDVWRCSIPAPTS
jgi:hypothetical protein